MLREPLAPDPAFPRYTERLFPAYRYVPTLNPHPCADPRGHSFEPPGHKPVRPPLPPPLHWRECEAYLFGADLYNHAYWWEAHETWEGIWQSSNKRGVQGRFLQGLIQVSAAQLKRHMGQREGMLRLLERSRVHLDFVSLRLAEASDMRGAIPRSDEGRFMGLALPTFLQHVERFFAAEPGAEFPFLVLGQPV